MNKIVDTYFSDGCGRCPLMSTPQCKVHTWAKELYALRSIMLDLVSAGGGLQEECKWGMPCYTWNGKNIVMLSAFKESVVLSFFKGVLLRDEDSLLEKPGENSESARFFRFTNVKNIQKNREFILSYILEAIENEKAGAKVQFKKSEEMDVPAEFTDQCKKDPALKKAFDALTPGRKKGYLLFFNSAKQAATRYSRIEKCRPLILSGKGLNDR